MVSDVRRAHRADRWLLAADAFLFGATLWIVVTAVAEGVLALFGASGQTSEEAFGAFGASVVWFMTTIVPIFGGAMLAWALHRRRFGPAAAAGMLVGLVAGGAVAMTVFVGGAMLLNRLPIRTQGPPWLFIGVIAVIALAIFVVPVVDAARDVRVSEQRHVALDLIRIVAFALTALLALFVLPLLGAAQGSELGEAGLFMVPLAAAAAGAALGADYVSSWADRRRERSAGTAAPA